MHIQSSADLGLLAYSTACSTSFNGFSNVRKTIYVTSESKWDRKDSGVWSEDEGIPMQ